MKIENQKKILARKIEIKEKRMNKQEKKHWSIIKRITILTLFLKRKKNNDLLMYIDLELKRINSKFENREEELEKLIQYIESEVTRLYSKGSK